MQLTNPFLRDLSDPDADRLKAAAERFEEAWLRGERPAIEAFLPADEPLRSAALFELVQTELEYRLRDAGATAACPGRTPGGAAGPPAPGCAAPGPRVGRFVLLDRLGAGAHATVYRAADPVLGRTV